MNENDTIFLAKIQLLMNTFDELDKMIENQPSDQQQVDFMISGLLHLIQNEDLTDETMLEVSKKLKEARIKRAHLQNLSHIIKAYVINKSALAYQNKRHHMQNAIENILSRLNQDYNYRVLDKNDIIELKHEVKKRSRRSNITKEELLECIEKSMKTNDIAIELNTSSSNICHLKQKYGIASRKYNKKG